MEVIKYDVYQNQNFYCTALGKIYRKKDNKEMKLYNGKSGIRITLNNKTYTVSRLIYQSITGCVLEDSDRIIHKNGILDDLYIMNLKRLTFDEYNKYMGNRNKYRGGNLKEIVLYDEDGRKVEVYHSISECARRLHLSKSHVHRIINGEVKNPCYILKKKGGRKGE
jgi:AraC-like DNA-binding protein